MRSKLYRSRIIRSFDGFSEILHYLVSKISVKSIFGLFHHGRNKINNITFIYSLEDIFNFEKINFFLFCSIMIKNCLFVVSPKLFIQLCYYFPPHPFGHKHGLQSSNVANHSFRFYGTLSTYIRSRGRGGGLVVTVSTCTRLGKGYLHLGLYQKYIPRE